MKTLIVTLEYPPQIGGIANYLFNFISEYPNDSIVVLAPPAPGAAEFDARYPWKVYRRQPFFSFFWPRWIRLFFQAWQIVGKEKIEELHIHHVLPSGYVGYLLKKFKKISGYTVFLHGTDVALALRDNRKRQWFQKICSQADKLVVNSQFLADKVKEQLPGAVIKIVHPCPASYFSEPLSEEIKASYQSHLALQGKKVLLTVARMVEGKGYAHLVNLLPKLIQKFPNIVWLIVGDGPKKADIITFIQKNNLQNFVRFLGVVPNEHLPVLYQLADVFVLLTHPDQGVEEGWGTVFLEAAAAGVPVVAGQSGGAAEAVQDGVTGYVVDTTQEALVLEKILSLLQNPEQARTMGQQGRARAAETFTWSKQLAKV